MNLGLAAATFALVIPAELPDKTFISAVVLSTRHHPLPVWLGAASGLILQAGIAVLAGRLLALLPHRVVGAIVALLFLGGAAYLLFTKEEAVEAEAGKLAEAEEELAAGTTASTTVVSERSLRIVGASFLIVALAEFGDLTQVLVANLSARSRDPLSVFVGAAVGFILISGVGVVAGRTLTRVVPLTVVRRLSGLALLGLGIWSVVEVA
ncbi:MAG TPA: TMEM165/GDT1 family protein [Acidimicrobiales bacterium]|nr:TMEM165/GDT1 family protein [Acidimicrobiales bacterium]